VYINHVIRFEKNFVTIMGVHALYRLQALVVVWKICDGKAATRKMPAHRCQSDEKIADLKSKCC
jgi:hypothetical protein